MAIYRNKKTGDLVDAWMHSKEEDAFTLAFPNWLDKIWRSGEAYTSDDGIDHLKTAEGDMIIQDGALIVRKAGGVLSVAAHAEFLDSHSYEG